MTLRPFFRSFGVIVLLVWAGPAGAASDRHDTHHDLTVSLDPANGRLAVTDRISISGDGEVEFRLSPGLEIGRMSVDGRDTKPRGAAGRWRIDLGQAGEHQVVLEYAGTPAGRVAGRAFIGPGGSFLPEDSGWIPRFGDLPFTYRVAIDLPDPGRAVVPGRLESEAVAGGRYRAVFRGEAPVWGLVLIAGPYRISERFHGSIRLRTYFGPEVQSLAADYLDSVAGYLDFYRDWIGEYPFTSFFVVSGPLPVGLGYPNLTYIGSRVLRLPFIRHSSLGHEVLHSWWGNGVLIDGAGGNWAEGLTTFMADYTLAERRRAGAGREMRRGWLRDYAALPAERDIPADQFRSKGHDASQVVGYNKVAFFFHMLRRTLGREPFDRGLRRFWKRHKFRAAGWDDLRHAFETASGRDLGAFFRQWLTRAGAPRLSLGPAASARAAGEGGYIIDLTLLQEGPVYALRLPVVIPTETGERQFVIESKAPRTQLRLQTRDRPLGLLVDPDNHVFRRLHASETPPILRHVTLSGRTGTLILAGRPAMKAAARALAGRLLDTPPRYLDAESPLPPSPLLVIGPTDRIGAFLESAGLPGPPRQVAGQGTARAWTFRQDGRPVLIVAADDTPSLEALLGPLPHYGRQGYLVFNGRKVTKRGLGEVKDGPLTFWFD